MTGRIFMLFALGASATERTPSSEDDSSLQLLQVRAESMLDSDTAPAPEGEWKKIACPVIGALFKAGDLVPDSRGMITKAQTAQAMLRAGISQARITATTNGNFDHLPEPKEINVFNMDLQMASDKPLKLRNKEHDFSTGVRDGKEPSAKAYAVFERFITADGDADNWSQADVAAAIKYYSDEKTSNDLGGGMGGINSLSVMLSEFANVDGKLSKEEMRELFMESNYPAEFKQRRKAKLDGDTTSWKLITCPVMGALFKAGDLIPDKRGIITKAQTAQAMLTAGISQAKTTATTNGNFDHLPEPKEINLFNMDLQMASDKPLKLRNKEHDFSTGVRDGKEPSAKAYAVFERFIVADGDVDNWSQADAAAAIKYYSDEKTSNDLGGGMGGINSLSVMLSEFANADGQLSKDEMRELFMRSNYPAQFKQRRAKGPKGRASQ